jgi:hypothetical protein
MNKGTIERLVAELHSATSLSEKAAFRAEVIPQKPRCSRETAVFLISARPENLFQRSFSV